MLNSSDWLTDIQIILENNAKHLCKFVHVIANIWILLDCVKFL